MATVVIRINKKKEEASKITTNIIKSTYIDEFKDCERILIKPNLNSPQPSSTGATTHLEIIKGVIEALIDHHEIMIVESNATRSSFKDNIKGTGYDKLCNHFKIKIVNLSQTPTEQIILKGKNRSFILNLPSILFNGNIALINVPVMKTHIMAGATLGIKNLFGLIPQTNKSVYHPYLNELLVGIFRRFKPRLTILDGIEGMEGMGPLSGTPANAGVILTSTDTVA